MAEATNRITNEVVTEVKGTDKLIGLASQLARLGPAPVKVAGSFTRLGLTLKKISNLSKKASSVFQGLTGKLKGIDFKNPLKSLNFELPKANLHLTKFLSSIIRIAKYRIIRSAISSATKGIKEGTENLYQYSKAIGNIDASHASGAMDTLATNSLYLKNCLGSILAPVLPLVAKSAESMANAFGSASNAIAQFFALLTGKTTYTKAIKYPTQYADAVDNATESAKELKRTLLGFDEINRLDAPDNGSSSGGGGGLDYSSMFEESPVEDFLKNANFYALGEALAKKLEEVLSKINWGPIKKKAKEVGENIAMFINGFFENFDWTILGKTIGEGINTALSFVYGLVSTLNFGALGEALIRSMEGVVTALDWEMLGNTFSDLLKGALQYGIGILGNSKEFIDNLSNGIRNALEQIDWQDIKARAYTLGSQVGVSLTNFVKEMPWEETAQSLAEGFNTVVSLLVGFLENIDFGEIGRKIMLFITTAIKTVDWADVGNTLNDMMLGAMDFFVGLFEGSDQFFNSISKALKDMLSQIDWESISKKCEEAGKSLGEFLNNAVRDIDPEDMAKLITGLVNGAINAIEGFLSELDTREIVEWFGDFFAKVIDLVDWEAVGKIAVDILVNKVGSEIGKIENIVKLTKSFFSAFIKALVGADDKTKEDLGISIFDVLWQGIVTGLAPIPVQMFARIKALIKATGHEDLWDAGKEIIGGILTGIINALPSNEWIDKHIKDPILNGIKFVFGIHSPSKVMEDEVGTNLVSGVCNPFSTLWSGVEGHVDEFKTNVLEKFGLIGTDGSDIFDSLKGNINDKMGLARDIVSDIIGNMKGFFYEILTPVDDTFNRIHDKVNNVMGSITGFVSQAVSAIRSMFDFDIHMRLPHFSINWSRYDIGGFDFSVPDISVNWYAKGGFPDAGELFVAREAGAEMVGNINGHTAVANNDQIVEAISQGVYSAVTSALGRRSGDTVITIDGREVFRAVVNQNNATVYQTGSSPLLI